MKTHRPAAAAFCAAFLLVLTAAESLRAKTLDYPQEDPAFSIVFPESWTASITDNSLQAGPADKSVSLSIAELEDADDLKSGAKDCMELMEKTGKIKEIKQVAERDSEVNGVKWHTIDATAKDKDGAEVQVTIATFTLDGDSIFWLCSYAAPQPAKAHEKELKDISASIKKK